MALEGCVRYTDPKWCGCTMSQLHKWRRVIPGKGKDVSNMVSCKCFVSVRHGEERITALVLSSLRQRIRRGG